MKIWTSFYSESDISYTENIKIYRQTTDEGQAVIQLRFLQEFLAGKNASMILQVVQEVDLETLATTCQVVGHSKRTLPKTLELNKRAKLPPNTPKKSSLKTDYFAQMAFAVQNPNQGAEPPVPMEMQF